MALETGAVVEKLDVRGTEIAYRRAGDGSSLLFLHGLGFSKRWWPLYDRLAQHFDVIVPDLPGFGDSPQAPWMSDFDDMVLVLAEFADAIGAGRFHLVGHSFGGWVAAEFAAFYPERVASLVLITPLGARVPGDMPVDLFRRGAQGRLELMVGDRAAGLFPSATQEDRIERLTRDYLDLTGFGRLAWNPRYDIRLERRLGRVNVPSLVVGVEDDKVLPASHIDAYAKMLPNSTVTIVRAAAGEPTGHGVVVQEPEALAAKLMSFIGEK